MRLLTAIAVVGALGTGCLTPSIPIPPPDADLVTAELTGEPGATTVTFTYPAEERYAESIVYVFNRDNEMGVIQAVNDDGSVGPTQPVLAELGDQIVLSFQRDDQTVSTCFKLREGNQSSTAYCD